MTVRPAGAGQQRCRPWHRLSVAGGIAPLVGTLLFAFAFCGLPARAQLAPAAASMPIIPRRPPAEQGPPWRELKPAQQAALQPLEQEWPLIEAHRKQGWLELAAGFPTLSPDAQARVQNRMTEWVRMTPLQRSAARLRFQELKQLPSQDKQARWNAYQALSPEQKQRLAERAAPPPLRKPGSSAHDDPAQPDLRRSGLVPIRAPAASSQSPALALVQARPGATTSLVTKTPSPPSHQQAGAPKIAATPGAVNKATLLPQRGPQAASPTASAASVAAPSGPLAPAAFAPGPGSSASP